jgi:hypothetical protein
MQRQFTRLAPSASSPFHALKGSASAVLFYAGGETLIKTAAVHLLTTHPIFAKLYEKTMRYPFQSKE